MRPPEPFFSGFAIEAPTGFSGAGGTDFAADGLVEAADEAATARAGVTDAGDGDDDGCTDGGGLDPVLGANGVVIISVSPDCAWLSGGTLSWTAWLRCELFEKSGF